MKLSVTSNLLAILPFTIFSSVTSFAFVEKSVATLPGLSSHVALNDRRSFADRTKNILKAGESDDEGVKDSVDYKDVGFVLLAGGTGSRMKANMPKQFLMLKDVPVLHHSLHLFLERLQESAAANGKR